MRAVMQLSVLRSFSFLDQLEQTRPDCESWVNIRPMILSCVCCRGFNSDVLVPISVNQEEQELRLMVSKRTTWLGSEPWLMATHTSGYSCSGTTSISNTFSGLGRGKSKCWSRKTERGD